MSDQLKADIENLRRRNNGSRLDLVNRIIRTFEAMLADEKKRGDDLQQSIDNIRKDFPQDAPRKFRTNVKTK